MAIAPHFHQRRMARRGGPRTAFDDFFRDFGRDAWWPDAESAPDMRVDIRETGDAFLVDAEIPGAAKDDIDIAVDGNRVTISAEARREETRKDAQDLLVERSWGKAYRVFTLPAEVDAAGTKARYEQGVLALTLPKKAAVSARRIPVQ